MFCRTLVPKAFGIPGSRGDGNNVETVSELAQTAINHCRDQQGPYFLELETYRWREHCGPNYDNDIGYRSESDYQKWKKKCPIENFEKKLMDSKNIEKHQIDHMRQTIIQEFEEAVDFAKSSPLPSFEDISKNLFKEIDSNPISK